MRIETFERAHLALIEAQASQADELKHQPEPPPEFSTGWTAFEDDRVIACGGVAPAGERDGLVWSLLSKHAGPHMVSLTSLARYQLEGVPYERLFAYAIKSFAPGLRWLRLLGFEPMKPRNEFVLPDGRTGVMFVREDT